MRDDCITIALGLQELKVLRHWEEESRIVVEVAYRAEKGPCPGCGQWTPKVPSTRLQRKRDRRLGDKPVYLVVHKRRFRCWACRKVFTEPDPVSGPRRRSRRRFREYLARREGEGEGLVRRSVTEVSRQLLGVPGKPEGACVLGLDEFSLRKGQVYDTAIMDLEGKQVIGGVTGHGQEGVAAFFTDLPAPEEVQVVVRTCMNPSARP